MNKVFEYPNSRRPSGRLFLFSVAVRFAALEAALGFGEGHVDLGVVGVGTKAFVGGGLEIAAGGDVKIIVGLYKYGFTAGLAQTEE